MFGMETWMDFEQALQSDESMQSSFQTVVENLIRSGVQDERELLVRAAKEMGHELHRAPADGLEALGDDALNDVAGGRAMDGEGAPFNFNSWIGGVLRDLLRRNSAANAARAGEPAPDTLLQTLPKPSTPEITELKNV